MEEAKGHRVGLGRAEKCGSVTGETDSDGWARVRANVERKPGERKEPRESRGLSMEFR